MSDTKRFLLNTNSKKIHDLQNCTGQCRISLMREEYKHYFDTLEEACNYPNAEAPLAKRCKFCISADN